MNVQAEPITLSELMAEVLPKWESKALEGMVIYIVDENDICVEDVKANRAHLARSISKGQVLVTNSCRLNYES